MEDYINFEQAQKLKEQAQKLEGLGFDWDDECDDSTDCTIDMDF